MKLLIADDDPMARFLLESFLKQWGHTVVAADDGAMAWQLFQDEDYPIVLTDWLMPEMDGLELIRRIRAAPRPGYVYIILLTSLSQKEDLVHGMDAGADDFLAKPYYRDELRVRIQQGERVILLERSLEDQNRALREAQATLVQQEKLASLGQLAAGMAHEINNPIAYVSNNLSVLQRDVAATFELIDVHRAGRDAWARVEPDRAAAAARLEESIDLAFLRETLPRLFRKSLDGLQRVRDIVANLRDFARLDEAEFDDVDLNAALTATVEILRYDQNERQVQVHTLLGEIPSLPCRPGKLNQVFLNVLRNALQACGPGGVVTVRTRMAPGPAILVEIEDNGSGIQPEHLPHIFEPFFTTRPVGQGTGLGLSVSYGIVRDHGGTIEAESVVGRGSIFRIRLPLRPPPAETRSHEHATER